MSLWAADYSDSALTSLRRDRWKALSEVAQCLAPGCGLLHWPTPPPHPEDPVLPTQLGGRWKDCPGPYNGYLRTSTHLLYVMVAHTNDIAEILISHLRTGIPRIVRVSSTRTRHETFTRFAGLNVTNSQAG